MPDRADVEQALAAMIADTLYPHGADSDSVLGNPCRIYRGWPVPAALDADLARGFVHVTVQSVSGTVRDRTRFSQDWQGSVAIVTLTGAVAGEAVRFSGLGAVGQVAGIRVDDAAYVYRLREGDTAALVAAALAAQIVVNRPAVATNATVALPGARGLLARVVADGDGGRELRRQESGFAVTLWCPDAGTRDRAAAVVDTAIAGVTFLDVGGWDCRLRLGGGSSSDEGSVSGAWRRDFVYSIEYPTVLTETLPAMLFGVADVNGIDFLG